jgi:hypothetical protein
VARNRILSSALLALVLANAGCHRHPAPAPGQQAQPGQPGPTASSESRSSWQFFKKKLPPPPAEIWKQFDGDQAFAHVTALVNLGPRPTGSPALQKSRDYIISKLAQFGWEVKQQSFEDETPRGKARFVNLIARFAGDAKSAPDTTQTVIISSHYDTKIFDTITFVGASDGGSSTGALIELARVLAMDPEMAKRCELVFFDGEEAVTQFTDTDGLYGSRYYAHDLAATKRKAQFKFGILWDMIGDKDLTITLSPYSPPDLAKGILGAATALNVRENFSYFDRDIKDDHAPLNDIGIPSIDIIDFDYVYWHTADDTLDKLSPVSLRKVGAVTLYFLRQSLGQK